VAVFAPAAVNALAEPSGSVLDPLLIVIHAVLGLARHCHRNEKLLVPDGATVKTAGDPTHAAIGAGFVAIPAETQLVHITPTGSSEPALIATPEMKVLSPSRQMLSACDRM
jgi:hypothetical protein